MQELQEYILPTDSSVKSDLAMKDFGKILHRRRRVIWFVVGLALLVSIVLSLIPHRWYAEAQVTLVQTAQSASVNAQETYAAPWVEQVGTPFDMIQTTEAYKRALDWMKNDAIARGEDPKKIGYDLVSFPKHVKVANTKGSNTIDITSWAMNEKDAIELANAAAHSFVQWKQEQAQNDVDLAIENYKARVRDSKTSLTKAENLQTHFLQAHHVADISTQERDFLTLLSQRQSTLLDAQQDAASQQARLGVLKQQLSQFDTAIASGTGVRDDSKVQDIQSKLMDAETELDNVQLHYTKAYPNKIGDLTARIALLKSQLADEVKGTIDNSRPSLPDQNNVLNEYRSQQVDTIFSQSKLAAAQQLYNQAKADTQSFPAMDIEYVRLSRDVAAATAQYNALVSALNQAVVDKNTIVGDVQMTNSVVPDEFSRIQYTILFVVVGLLLGLFAAACTVLILEQGDSKLYSVEEIRRLLSGPVIGALPDMSGRERRALASGIVPNTIGDVFNVARNNLQLVMRHFTGHDLWDNQVILVASAGPDEGKSMTAGQLARSMAASGRTVILVDANLRPEKEKGAIVPRTPQGLAQVLAEGASLDSVVVPGKTPNLSFLPSGESRGHSTDLISLPSMLSTIAALRQKADVIVMDAPACTLATDALYLAPFADCVLQVIGVGVMDESTLADTVAALQAAAPKVITYMINRSPRPKRKAGKFQYYSLELNSSNGKNGNGALPGTNGTLLSGTSAPVAMGASSEIAPTQSGATTQRAQQTDQE